MMMPVMTALADDLRDEPLPTQRLAGVRDMPCNFWLNMQG